MYSKTQRGLRQKTKYETGYRLKENIFLTELKRLRGRLDAVRCNLESGIAICGAQCNACPQLSADPGGMALDGGLRPGPPPLAADLGRFLEAVASPVSALHVDPVSTGNFILKFFIKISLFQII